MVRWIDMWEMGIYAALAPWVLAILASIWRYPAVLEEVVKWAILRNTIYDLRLKIYDSAVVGMIFGLSEAILYSNNVWTGGEWGVMGSRLLMTVPMHTLTALIIAWGMKNKVGWVGVGVAMVVHAGFNYLVN